MFSNIIIITLVTQGLPMLIHASVGFCWVCVPNIGTGNQGISLEIKRKTSGNVVDKVIAAIFFLW